MLVGVLGTNRRCYAAATAHWAAVKRELGKTPLFIEKLSLPCSFLYPVSTSVSFYIVVHWPFFFAFSVLPPLKTMEEAMKQLRTTEQDTFLEWFQTILKRWFIWTPI